MLMVPKMNQRCECAVPQGYRSSDDFFDDAIQIFMCCRVEVIDVARDSAKKNIVRRWIIL